MALVEEAHVDALKKHIQRQLEPICEADSNVLSDYIIALLRHDMAASDLKAFCREQLQDFLAEHTVGFVEALFASLNARSFLPGTTQPIQVHLVQPSAQAQQQSQLPREPQPQLHQSSSNALPARPPASVRPQTPPLSGPIAPPHQSMAAGSVAPGMHHPGPHTQGMPVSFAQGPPPHSYPPRSGPPAQFPNAPGPYIAGYGPPPGPMHGPPQPIMTGSMPPSFGHHPPLSPTSAGGPPLPPSGITTKELRRGSDRGPRRCRDFDEKGVCMRGDTCPYEHIGPVVRNMDWQQRPGPGGPHARLAPNDMGHTSFIDPMQHRLGPPSGPVIGPHFGQQPTQTFIGSNGGPGPMHMQGPPPLQQPQQPPISGSQPSGGFHQGFPQSFQPRPGRGGSYPPRPPSRGSSGPGPGSRYMGGREPNPSIIVDGIPPEHCQVTALSEYFSRFGPIDNVNLLEQERRAMITFNNVEDAKAAHSSPVPIFDNRFIKVYWYSPERHAVDFGLAPPSNMPPGFARRGGRSGPGRGLGRGGGPAGREYYGGGDLYHNGAGGAPSSFDYNAAAPSFGATPATSSPLDGSNFGAAPGGPSILSAQSREQYAELVKKKEAQFKKMSAMRAAMHAKLESAPPEKRTDLESLVVSLDKQIDEIKSSLLRDPQAKAVCPQLIKDLQAEKKRQLLDRELDMISHQAASARSSENEVPSQAMSTAASVDGSENAGFKTPAPNAAPAPDLGALPTTRKSQPFDWNAVKSKYSLDLRPTTLKLTGLSDIDQWSRVVDIFREFGDVEEIFAVMSDGTSVVLPADQELDWSQLELTSAVLLVKYTSRAAAEKAMKLGPTMPGVVDEVKVEWTNNPK